MCNTYCFSTATMVTRKRLCVTLCVHFVSYSVFSVRCAKQNTETCVSHFVFRAVELDSSLARCFFCNVNNMLICMFSISATLLSHSHHIPCRPDVGTWYADRVCSVWYSILITKGYPVCVVPKAYVAFGLILYSIVLRCRKLYFFVQCSLHILL